jgi:N-acetylglucosamine-6-sulfatase
MMVRNGDEVTLLRWPGFRANMTQNDPVQMNNLYGTNGTINGWGIEELTTRLDTLLLTLKACKGQVCTRPWETLHPQGNVSSLRGAMNRQFDDFYTTQQPKVTFSACKDGYLAAYEGAMAPTIYAGQQELRAVR